MIRHARKKVSCLLEIGIFGLKAAIVVALWVGASFLTEIRIIPVLVLLAGVGWLLMPGEDSGFHGFSEHTVPGNDGHTGNEGNQTEMDTREAR